MKTFLGVIAILSLPSAALAQYSYTPSFQQQQMQMQQQRMLSEQRRMQQEQDRQRRQM